MACRLALVLVAVLWCGTIQASAQHTPGSAAEAGQATSTHGIIRKPRPKATEPVKTTEPSRAASAAPASTEAVAAAVAKAVRSAEDAKKPAPGAVPQAV